MRHPHLESMIYPTIKVKIDDCTQARVTKLLSRRERFRIFKGFVSILLMDNNLQTLLAKQKINPEKVSIISQGLNGERSEGKCVNLEQ